MSADTLTQDDHTAAGGEASHPEIPVLPPSGFGKLAIAAGIVILVVAYLVSLAAGNQRAFFFGYLYGYLAVWTLPIGALFFVAIQHITRAGWSVVVRRMAEIAAQMIRPLTFAFIPIALTVLFGSHVPYVWVDTAGAVEAGLMDEGTAAFVDSKLYLSEGRWLIFAVVFFAVWNFLAARFLKLSRQQDETGDPAITLKLERMAPLSIIALALTATFAAVDWVMTLAPTWYSTIYGVYFFAASTVCFYAVTSIVSVIFWKKGTFQGLITIEHFHDLGKLLFGFNCFWAYIAFSQYLLIWYANIPEETEFFQPRYHNGWGWVSVLLVVGHFLLPFFGLLSRHVKRNPMGLFFWAVWLLAIHLIDVYWLIIPFRDHHTHGGPFGGAVPMLITVLCLIGFVAIALGRLRNAATDVPLIPTNDPRLPESLHFKNH